MTLHITGAPRVSADITSYAHHMKTFIATTCAILTVVAAFYANQAKPKIKVAANGFPAGHDTPEGVACDLARSFIKHDIVLFANTCIQPFGASETFGTNYQTFLKNVIRSMKEEASRKEPSLGAPKTISKVFAARHLSARGPESLAYAIFDSRGVMFVDLKTTRVIGDSAPYRIFVIKKSDEKWYVYPTPKSDSLLCAGLDSETKSTRDFSEAYEVQK
jgi:hypothetical protein